VLARRRARSGERDDEGHDDPEVGGLLEVPTVKFMPSTPAMSAPGSRSIEPSVRTFTISFVRSPTRASITSNEPTTDSRVSRAAATAISS
jgi:hypothetical protein